MRPISANRAAKMSAASRSRIVREAAERIEKGKLSDEANKLLEYFFREVEEATEEGYKQVVITPSKHAVTSYSTPFFMEFSNILRELGYKTEPTCSSNWCNESLFINWK